VTTARTLRRLLHPLNLLLVVAPVAAFLLWSGSPSREVAAGPKTKISTPAISCAGSTQVSINIQVCAGATGLPAGFSIQWMTAADYVANGEQWYASDDTRLCKASFSGNASLSRYNLAADECVTVNVGEFLFDNGASTNCDGALTCGTTYVFRCFGHANGGLQRSDFTANLACGTMNCGRGETCTLTQGYWKTHNDTVCVVNPDSPLCRQWPCIPSLGTVTYSQAELLSIFNTPAGGNGLIALAHQLIAAKLNMCNGAEVPDVIVVAILAADALIGDLVVPPVGAGFLKPGDTSR
jgi:hypothetical protein